MGAIARFEQAFLALREQRPLCRSLTFTGAGLVLGAGTSVAPMRRDGEGAETLDLSGEDRILALLAAAFSAPVKATLLVKLRHASALWAQGDKSLAQIHLEHLRLPKLDSEEQAFRLFLADRLIASGHSPRRLCKVLGFDLPKGLRKFDSDQPCDGHGRWTSGGGGGEPAHHEEPQVTVRPLDHSGAQPSSPSPANSPESNPAHTSYEFSGNTASQTSTNTDGTSVVTTWELNRGSGLSQTDQIRLANGDIAATSVTNSKATQTLSLSDAGAKAGLVIAQPRGGDPTLIPAAMVSVTGTPLLQEGGPIMTHIGRWFASGVGAGVLSTTAFYFGSTAAAGPEDETTPVGAGDQFQILSNPDTVSALVQRKTGDGWTNTGLAVINHEITSDGSPAAAQHLRDLTAAVAAIPDIGPQPLRADTPVPDVFKDQDPSQLRELNFDGYLQADATGQQTDGSIGLLALSVRGGSWAAGDERPVIGNLSQEEVETACPAYPKVQSVTSSSDAQIRAQNPDATPQEIGNMVHKEVDAAFKGQPGFKTNAGFLKDEELKNGLRLAGSSFLDVLHDVGNGTICIFDIKTGLSGLGSRQINQYWNAAKDAFEDAQRIYILEVRP